MAGGCMIGGRDGNELGPDDIMGIIGSLPGGNVG